MPACRATCGACVDDGGGKRRAQITSSCPLSNFDAKATEVNQACCDDASCNGVPTACDAKCAIVFDEFFEDCSTILGLQMSDHMAGFTSLHTTCSQQLPVEPLLRAVVDCGTQARVDAINANDYSSWEAMQAVGWTWDSNRPANPHGVWRADQSDMEHACTDGNPIFWGYSALDAVGTLSLVLPAGGTGVVDFSNCCVTTSQRNNCAGGTVVLAINGVEVMTAPATVSRHATITFSEGDVLTLQDQGPDATIRLNSLRLNTYSCRSAPDDLGYSNQRCDAVAQSPACTSDWSNHMDDFETPEEYCANLCASRHDCQAFWVYGMLQYYDAPGRCCMKGAFEGEGAGCVSNRNVPGHFCVMGGR